MSLRNVRLLTLVYFVVAVAMRFLPHGVNFNAVAALALFAGCYLSVTQGMLLGLGAMALSDVIGHALDIDGMGFYYRPTMLAVYAGLALPGLLGWALRGRVSATSVPAAGVASAILFFVVSNFAVWLDPNMGFAQTPAGLVKCYVDAIPFALNAFLSTVLFSCIFFGIHAWLGLSPERRPSLLRK